MAGVSLQPGPEDPKDERSLIQPPAETTETGGTEDFIADEGSGQQASGSREWPPAAPSSGPPADASAPPPAATWQPAPQAPPPPASGGWGAPQPPDQSYAPPPSGAYAGPPPDYPPPGYPPQGYQAVGYGQPAQTDSMAIVGLILAIASWVVCPLVTAVIALVVAGQSSRAIDGSSGRLEGRTLNTATKVISWINIVVSVIAIVALIGFLVVGFTIDGTTVINDTPQF